MKHKLVIIGNGMAPGRMLEDLFEQDAAAFDVTIFNAEPRVNYNRLMLSPVLSGEKTYDDIITHDDAWYEQHGITLHKGSPIESIDADSKTVTSSNGITASYEKLVIATGSNPIVIPISGSELEGVITYRDLDDVNYMLKASKICEEAVVIGGGLLGLEAAAGLHAQGMNVTVIHLAPFLMERQLDESAARLLEKALELRGIRIITKANTKNILGVDGKVNSVELDSDETIAADIVCMAVGIRPSTQLAQAAGLAVNRGVLVGDDMRTSDASIFALGECVEHRDQCYGLVAPLYQMGTVVARNLLNGSVEYKGSVTATKLKVNGIDLYSAGDFAEADDREEIILRDAQAGIYKRLVLKDNRIIGAVLYGDTLDGPWFFDLLKKQEDISDSRDTLIFGQAYQGGEPLDPIAAVAALPDDAEICGCNGICKSKITDAIASKSLTTLDEVRAHTKASSSCGTCTGLVEQVMALTLGDAYNPSAVTPMCPCTDLGHSDVRRLIKAKKLKSIPDVQQALEWNTGSGCAKCRPALNYYLVADWPSEYADDYQSRFINERAHANIQRDGTYSVVPRMWVA